MRPQLEEQHRGLCWGPKVLPYEQETGNFHHKVRQSLLIQPVQPKPTLPLRAQKTMGRDCLAPGLGKWKISRPGAQGATIRRDRAETRREDMFRLLLIWIPSKDQGLEKVPISFPR